jgi:trimethylamine--corrinoid protein Co-methyltransferase
MELKGLTGGLYKPLSPKDIETIHQASLAILENTGISYESGLNETIDMFDAQGAKVDRERGRIFFPGKLVETQAARAPERVVLFSRDGKNDLDLTQHRVYLGTGGAAIKILDLESGRARSTKLEDLYQLARLVDALDNIHFFLRPCIPTDIPEDEYDANVFYTCLKATGKHFMAGVNDVAGFHQAMDIAAMVAGDMAKLKDKPFAGSCQESNSGCTVLCSHGRLDFPADHGRDSGSTACRAACRNYRLPANKPRRTNFIRRNPRHGES